MLREEIPVNKELIAWARQRVGFTLDEARINFPGMFRVPRRHDLPTEQGSMVKLGTLA